MFERADAGRPPQPALSAGTLWMDGCSRKKLPACRLKGCPPYGDVTVPDWCASRMRYKPVIRSVRYQSRNAHDRPTLVSRSV
jgi:hypothetical protein